MHHRSFKILLSLLTITIISPLFAMESDEEHSLMHTFQVTIPYNPPAVASTENLVVNPIFSLPLPPELYLHKTAPRTQKRKPITLVDSSEDLYEDNSENDESFDAHTIKQKKSRAVEKSYACDRCDKVFTVSHYLARHLRHHSGKRPYVCDFPGCDKDYKEKHHLKEHKLSHSDPSFQCPQCDQLFYRSNERTRHLKTVHHPIKFQL